MYKLVIRLPAASNVSPSAVVAMHVVNVEAAAANERTTLRWRPTPSGSVEFRRNVLPELDFGHAPFDKQPPPRLSTKIGGFDEDRGDHSCIRCSAPVRIVGSARTEYVRQLAKASLSVQPSTVLRAGTGTFDNDQHATVTEPLTTAVTRVPLCVSGSHHGTLIRPTLAFHHERRPSAYATNCLMPVLVGCAAVSHCAAPGVILFALNYVIVLLPDLPPARFSVAQVFADGPRPSVSYTTVAPFCRCLVLRRVHSLIASKAAHLQFNLLLFR